MPKRLPRHPTPASFAAGARAVSAVLALHATPASSLAFSFPVTNRSLDHADHHQQRNAHDGGGNPRWAPVRLRRGRERVSSLFSRLRASNDLEGRGAAGGGGNGRGAGGARLFAAAAAATTGVPKEDEPFVLEGVKNIRDLSTVEGYGIAAGRVFRTGHLSAATKRDAKTLRDSTGLRTLVSTWGGGQSTWWE